jgi:16S rRNA (guanine527-N7)-methyltransferase
VFGSDRLPVAQQYADLLADAGVVRGLIGPREVPRLWERHLVNCALLADQIAPGARVADIGSGAGLPGLVLAIVRPDLRVTLVEPLLRRATFLQEAIGELALENVVVVRARAEALHADSDVAPGFDVVTARAVAPLERLLDWCMPLVAPRGELVALKGSAAPVEVEAAASTLRSWGCTAPVVVPLGEDRGSDTTWAVRVGWSEPDSVSWPARRRPDRSRAHRRRRR